MSRKNRHNRFRNRIPAKPAPQSEAPIQQIPLKTVEWLGVLNVLNREKVIQQQQQNLMAESLKVQQDKRAVIGELEKAYGFSEGAIERGEVSIQDGVIVYQGQVAEVEQSRTGTEG